jgi:regulator of protease activity HflC (stomatin/prohibitin superfamily)
MEDKKQNRDGRNAIGSENEAGTRAMDEALQSSFTILKLVIAVLAVYLVFSNTSAVEGDSEGVIILRFGQPHSSSPSDVWKSGIRFAMPYPLEERVRIARETPLKTEFFKYAAIGQLSIGESMANRPVNADQDGYVLTRDNKILHISATLNYTILEPSKYVFEFADAQAVLKVALESAITHVASENKLDDIYGRTGDFSIKVRDRLSILANEYGLGVRIKSVNVSNADVELPFQVRKARGQLEGSAGKVKRILSEANQTAERIRKEYSYDASNTNALGEVATIINNAHSEANARVARVDALWERFLSIHGGKDGQPVRSAESKRLALQRHYYTVINRLMEESDIKVYYIASRPDGSKQKIHLQINPKPPSPKPSALDAAGGSSGQ